MCLLSWLGFEILHQNSQGREMLILNSLKRNFVKISGILLKRKTLLPEVSEWIILF